MLLIGTRPYFGETRALLIPCRDCTQLNIMMDPRPTFPDMFHPGDISRSRDFKSKAKFYTRTSRPTKYLFIDFGLSVRFPPGQDRRVIPIRGGDRTVPEFEWYGIKKEHDPFPVDVYYLGNLIREEFLQVSPISHSAPQKSNTCAHASHHQEK